MMAELVSLKEGICHASQHILTYKHDMNVIKFYILYNVEINSLSNYTSIVLTICMLFEISNDNIHFNNLSI